MNVFSKILHNLPTNVQRLVVDRVGESCAISVKDFILHINCPEFGGVPNKDDLHCIRLCVALGWVTQAVIHTVKHEYLRYYGSYVSIYRRVSFDDVRPILRALNPLPYTIEDQHREQFDPTFERLPSYNVRDPPYCFGPYRRYSFTPWNPVRGYNNLDDHFEGEPWPEEWSVLHTGDCRATAECCARWLFGGLVDCLFLDLTFGKECVRMPSREDAINQEELELFVSKLKPRQVISTTPHCKATELSYVRNLRYSAAHARQLSRIITMPVQAEEESEKAPENKKDNAPDPPLVQVSSPIRHLPLFGRAVVGLMPSPPLSFDSLEDCSTGH
ncbi:hypothetical protein L7F22_057768 [Adiantum nelumboides]|nr:hypothetical protein [Adiantum nelumboides]